MAWLIGHLVGDYLMQNDWMALNKKQRTWPCVVHVSLYTLAIWAFTFWPLWALAVVWLTHFAQDRTQIINWWMRAIGQGKFATAPMAPWSMIVVDNVWHLVVLYWVSLAVGI